MRPRVRFSVGKLDVLLDERAELIVGEPQAFVVLVAKEGIERLRDGPGYGAEHLHQEPHEGAERRADAQLVLPLRAHLSLNNSECSKQDEWEHTVKIAAGMISPHMSTNVTLMSTDAQDGPSLTKNRGSASFAPAFMSSRVTRSQCLSFFRSSRVSAHAFSRCSCRRSSSVLHCLPSSSAARQLSQSIIEQAAWSLSRTFDVQFS